jgi:hypothetical protein
VPGAQVKIANIAKGQMEFDFGDILTRAWKITWKHKVLWVISVLPFLTMFLLLPFWLILLLQKKVDFNAISTWMENPIYSTIAILVYLIVMISSWKCVLITLIVYFGMNILISIVAFPLMIPMFFFMMRTMEVGIDFNSMIRMQAVVGVVLLPLMALVQGFSQTYIKSAMMLTYLRLTRPELSPPLLPRTVEAPA